MKVCTRCKHAKSDDSFPVVQRRGRPYRVPTCQPCRNAYQRDRWAGKPLREPVVVRKPTDPLNQTASLWFGPANRSEPLRWRQ